MLKLRDPQGVNIFMPAFKKGQLLFPAWSADMVYFLPQQIVAALKINISAHVIYLKKKNILINM